MTKKINILLLPGDGVGPEVCKEANKLFLAVSKRFNLDISVDEDLIGGVSIDKNNSPITDKVISGMCHLGANLSTIACVVGPTISLWSYEVNDNFKKHFSGFAKMATAGGFILRGCKTSSRHHFAHSIRC